MQSSTHAYSVYHNNKLKLTIISTPTNTIHQHIELVVLVEIPIFFVRCNLHVIQIENVWMENVQYTVKNSRTSFSTAVSSNLGWTTPIPPPPPSHFIHLIWAFSVRSFINSKQASIVMTNCCDTVYGTQLFHRKLHLISAGSFFRCVSLLLLLNLSRSHESRIEATTAKKIIRVHCKCHWMLVKLLRGFCVCRTVHIYIDGWTLRCNLFMFSVSHTIIFSYSFSTFFFFLARSHAHSSMLSCAPYDFTYIFCA